MKRIEKYAGALASLIAKDGEDVCQNVCIFFSLKDYPYLMCDTCDIKGLCNDKEALEKWFLEEVSDDEQ